MTASNEIEVYVRLCETDAAGHVNNTSHFLYFEETRTKFFKEVCPERNSSFSFILASISCDYLSQSYAGQTLKVSTNVTKVGTKSFSVTHTLTATDTGITIAKANVDTVCFDYVKQKSVPIPNALRTNLEKHLVAPQKN